MTHEWFDRHSARLKAEQIIMNDRFPQFVLKKERTRLYWEGILVTNFGTQYRVKVVYPNNYPYQRPSFRVMQPALRHSSPHRFADGSLCVYPDHWEHKRCTAPAGVPLVAGWLAMYEIWLRTGKGW
jgi:ubiquitin-protein ligase